LHHGGVANFHLDGNGIRHRNGYRIFYRLSAGGTEHSAAK
jgi:hypothetical protein